MYNMEIGKHLKWSNIGICVGFCFLIIEKVPIWVNNLKYIFKEAFSITNRYYYWPLDDSNSKVIK